MNRATGAIPAISAGSESSVTVKKITTVWPLPVTRSTSRSACVTQITLVSPIRRTMAATAAIFRM